MEVGGSPKSAKKHKKRKDGDGFREAEAIPVRNDITTGSAQVSVQNGDGVPTSSHKKRKKKHLASEDSIDASDHPADGLASSKKRKKKHGHAEAKDLHHEDTNNEATRSDAESSRSAEDRAKANDEYANGIGFQGMEATSPKAQKKSKKHKVAGMDVSQMPYMPSLLDADTPAVASPSGPTRPTLSLMSSAPAFFASQQPFPVTSADIAVDPALAEETDTHALLRTINNRRDFERFQTSGQQDEREREIDRVLSPAEVAAARAHNKEDNEVYVSNGVQATTKGKSANSDDASNRKLLERVSGMSHADILATKWLSNPQLNYLGKEIGLICKTGKFSKAEDVLIIDAAQQYMRQHGLSSDEFSHKVNSSGRQGEGDRTVWIPVTRDLGYRSWRAVTERGERMYSRSARGKWTEEQDSLLRKAVDSFGTAWEKVEEAVGRRKGDCRDRWRNILKGGANRSKTSVWSPEEEHELDMAVRKFAKDLNIDILRRNVPVDLPWSAVSAAMGEKRTRLQCYNRWVDSTYRMLIGRGQLEGWTRFDEYMVIKRVWELQLASRDAIDWASLATDDWCRWSPALTKKRYERILNSAKLAKKLPTHKEQVQALYDSRVKEVDPDTLEKPRHSGWKGLKKLPDVPLSAYASTTKKVYTKSKLGEVRHTKLSKSKSAPLSDGDSGEVGTPDAVSNKSPIAKSSEFIEDSDADAA